MSQMLNVNCDNCSATYKISLDKIKKEKSRITCRRCQNKIVIYKSRLQEPTNESAAVTHEDEKTLVDDAPNPMEGFSDDPQTAISNTQPPTDSGVNEVSDPTIRKMTPPPVMPAVAKSSSAVVTSDNSKNDVKKEVGKQTNTAKPSSTRSRNSSDPVGVNQTFKTLAGLMGVSLVSLAVLPFVSGAAASVLGAIGVGALTMGLVLVITGDFGFVRPNLGIATGVGLITGALMGVATFTMTSDGGEQTPEQTVEQPTFTPPSVDVVTSEKSDVSQENAEKEVAKSVSKTGAKRSDRNTTTSSTSSGSTNGTRNLLKDEMAKSSVGNTGRVTPKPSSSKYDIDDEPVEVPERPETKPIAAADPIENFDDDLDLDGFDDLGLDDEPEEKGGLFGRRNKDEEEKPARKPESKPEPKASTGSGIPTSVLDIIIRNNQDVKGCYLQQRKETGSMPSSVKITFTLQPVQGGSKTTSVSSANIASGPYVGSKFEGCLKSAFRKMSFPSDNTAPTTLSYTLKI